MHKYKLDHLTQVDNQAVLGPIQDDEALFLFSYIRCCRLSTVLEIGGLEGYSARNFLEAICLSKNPKLYTVDIKQTPKLAENHYVVLKRAADVTPDDLNNNTLDLLFFDCHNFIQQKTLFDNLYKANIINDSTTIVMHDTNLHPEKVTADSYKISDGWVHQSAERSLVLYMKQLGYDCVNIHTTMDKHDKDLPFRHGLTICKKFKPTTI